MLDGTKRVPFGRVKIGHRRHGRQCAIVASLLLLAACGGVHLARQSSVGTVGYAVGDEPHAVNVARDILVHGGNAVDAATALGLALSVTLPSRASLGGGGACLVHTGRDMANVGKAPAETMTQSIEFMPRAAKGGAAIGMPGLPRGLFSLQAKYGRLRWEQLVAPAENMARFGTPASRALVRDIASAHAEINGPTGKPLAEGDVMVQPDLASSFAALRTRGGGDFYVGALANAIVAGSDGEIDGAALRAVSPDWASPEPVTFGNDVVYFSATPGGAFAEKLWRKVRTGADASIYATFLRVVGDRKSDAGNASERAYSVADAAAAMSPAAGSVSPSGGDAATGFVVVDGQGSAVACSLTMGRLFGAGRIIGTTGIRASLPVPGKESDGLSGAAMMVVNDNVSKFLATFAAGGDRSGPEAMVQVALSALVARDPVGDALSVARLYAAAPGALFAEPGLTVGQRSATSVPALGSVNAVVCPSGLPAEQSDCTAQSDPRSAGVIGTFQRQPPRQPDEATGKNPYPSYDK